MTAVVHAAAAGGRFAIAPLVALLLYFIPLYGLGIVAVWKGRPRAFVAALLMWIGVFALFHALTVLDFDWRHRMPLMPHFIALAACGADVLAARRSAALRRAPFF